MNANELVQSLRTLANRWALMARDYARDGKASKDEKQAEYLRGFAEGYYKAATELAQLVQNNPVQTSERSPAAQSATSAQSVASGQAGAAAQPRPDVPPAYTPIALGDVIDILNYSGVAPREVNIRAGNTIYALFSRWHPLSEHERIAKIAGADPRIVILSFGRTKDASDPYVEFAFKQG